MENEEEEGIIKKIVDRVSNGFGMLEQYGWIMFFTLVALYSAKSYLNKRNQQKAQQNLHLHAKTKKSFDENRRKAAEKMLDNYRKHVSENGEAKSYVEKLEEEKKKTKKKRLHGQNDYSGLRSLANNDSHQSARRWGSDRRRRGGG
eukprot:maker-scaffold_6-snap-gene-1.41-mRNA-1 protein AED:0.00 eAED:0.00 QI:96/1/1/1/0.6/0.5/6/704/145